MEIFNTAKFGHSANIQYAEALRYRKKVKKKNKKKESQNNRYADQMLRLSARLKSIITYGIHDFPDRQCAQLATAAQFVGHHAGNSDQQPVQDVRKSGVKAILQQKRGKYAI